MSPCDFIDYAHHSFKEAVSGQQQHKSHHPRTTLTVQVYQCQQKQALSASGSVRAGQIRWVSLSSSDTGVHAHQPIKRHGKRVSTITHTHANTNTNAHKYTYVYADTYTHTYVHRPFHHPVYITPTDIKHPINYCMSQNTRDQKCLRMKNS